MTNVSRASKCSAASVSFCISAQDKTKTAEIKIIWHRDSP